MFNPFLTNAFSNHYHLGDSSFILGHFSMKFLYANRIAPDGTPQSAASHLGLFRLHMSHKKDARLI